MIWIFHFLLHDITLSRDRIYTQILSKTS